MGLQLNGPKHIWKVYTRNNGCKKQIGSKEKVGLQEGHRIQLNSNEEKEFNRSPNNYSQATSPQLNGGSGLKEVVTWEGKYNEKHDRTTATSDSTPRSVEMVKDASSNWDMAKNMGVNFSTQEGIMISKMVSLEERDCYLKYKGFGEGFKMGFNQKNGEERTSRYVVLTRD